VYTLSKLIILTLLIVGIFTVGSLATNEAYAAIDMFLKIDDIKGESTTAGHEGEIDIETLQWGLTNQEKKRGGGGGAGKVTIQDLSFVMFFDKASPKLMQAVADGKQFPEAVITFRESRDGAEILTITLTEVLISSYQTGVSQMSPNSLLDEVSLNFGKILFEYPQHDSDGEAIDPVTGSASKHGRK